MSPVTEDCDLSSIERIRRLAGGSPKKKGSSFGTTAAASRGVFYELKI